MQTPFSSSRFSRRGLFRLLTAMAAVPVVDKAVQPARTLLGFPYVEVHKFDGPSILEFTGTIEHVTLGPEGEVSACIRLTKQRRVHKRSGRIQDHFKAPFPISSHLEPPEAQRCSLEPASEAQLPIIATEATPSIAQDGVFTPVQDVAQLPSLLDAGSFSMEFTPVDEQYAADMQYFRRKQEFRIELFKDGEEEA